MLGARSKLRVVCELERAGDAAFRRGDLGFAQRIYEALQTQPGLFVRMLLKQSDVAFESGDLDRERQLRESIYGRMVDEDG